MQAAQQLLSNPVARGLNILGDRWTILILRETFLGQHRFDEFRRRTGASRGSLSSRLETLVANGILYKNPYQTSPLRYEYRLTGKGLALYPWALLIWQWETEWADANDAELPTQLWHAFGEGHQLRPLAVCRHCGEPLHYDDVERVVNASPQGAPTGSLTEIGSQRRTRGSGDQMLGHITDIIGDRWTLLLMAMAFVGLSRYDDFRQQLGVATNILADRLKLLVDTGIFSREEYRSNPPRYEYHLTEKGKALYPLTMALRQWVLEWLPKVKHPLTLVHRPCGNELATDVICSGCHTVPRTDEVRFR
ncbi:winged helix-turn-helix transcriptional regulator [Spongiibacter tropicus]|uniref:winged helix-turn-helix transcriptional regulator n=1 Tax=Spongiibacter tropicus TaxID=454602 RepID=UPI0003B35966|nr:helix-turn-helix domain-containing protein [Spongiibacter tropicus]